MTTWEIYKVFKKSYDFLINLRMDSAIEKDNMLLFLCLFLGADIINQ